MKHKTVPNSRFLMAGQFSLVIGVAGSFLNASYFHHIPVLDLLCGLFMGFSMVMNLAFLLRYSSAPR
jgi:hypothetical protein